MECARRPSPQTVAVLLAIADDPDRWSHGYDLCRRLGLRAGTVYPILIRLAERGYVDTSWEQDVPAGPATSAPVPVVRRRGRLRRDAAQAAAGRAELVGGG